MNPKFKELLGPIAMVMIASLLASSTALAYEYVDIEQPIAYSVMQTGEYQQVFVPNAANISAVSLSCGRGTGNQTLQILDSVCGTVLAQGTIVTAQGWVKCDLIGVQALVPGQPYVMHLGPYIQLMGTSGNPYPDGALWNSCSNALVDYDIAFRTWADDEAVPNAETTWSTVKCLFR